MKIVNSIYKFKLRERICAMNLQRLLIGFLVVVLLTAGITFAQDTPLYLEETPRIAVISAYSPELQILLGEAEVTETHVLGGTTYYLGTLAGNDVVLFLSGVSMINA